MTKEDKEDKKSNVIKLNPKKKAAPKKSTAPKKNTRRKYPVDPPRVKARKKDPTRMQTLKNEIKAEYVTGTMPLIDLADKYDVGYHALRKAAERGGWGSERERLAVVVSDNMIRDKLLAKAEEREEFDKNCISLAKSLIAVVSKKIASLKKSNFNVSPTELLKYSTVVQKAQYIGRLALGEPTESLELIDRQAARFSFDPNNVEIEEYKKAISKALEEF